MADYICKHCKFNNNGWCVALKKNKLSETIECNNFKKGKYGTFETKEEVSKTDGIQEFGDINNDLAEGKLLTMAIAKLTCTIYTNKTPDEVIKILVNMAQGMDW